MRRTILLLVLGILALHDQAGAIGRVYARWPNNPNGPIYNLRIKTLHASVTIRDQLAVTRVDQEFSNDNVMRLEGFYVFKLPEGAQVHELYLWINGVRVAYQVKKREDAVEQYEQIVRGMADPALLESLGNNRFQLRIFPIDALSTRRIEIMYSQPLTFYQSAIQYVFPMDMHDYTSAPIEQATVSISISSQVPILDVQTSVDQHPTAVVVNKIDSLRYTVAYGVENVAFAKDFKVYCSLAPDSRTMLALAYRVKTLPTEPGTFMLWSIVPDTLSGDSARARELTIAADVSSSMEGERMVQLKEALAAFIDLLTEQDRFNIVTFSTGAAKFKPDLVAVTDTTRAEAHAFVTQQVALGMTNFEEGLRQSLLQSYTDSTGGALVFMTDGQPNWGETRTDSLLARIQRWNAAKIPVFSVAIGEEPDRAVMESIARQTGGSFTEIAADDSIYLRVKDLYRQLFLPKFKDPSFAFSPATVTEIYPLPLPDAFAGDRLLVTGRYAEGGTNHVTMSGSVLGTPIAMSQDIEFPDRDTVLFEIERYWGSQKIKSILDLIAQMGEQQELIDQVIALSIRYSVLTPYTAFLVVEPTGDITISIDNDPGHKPLVFALEPNYPNPFNPTTTIRYTVGGTGSIHVLLTIHDVLGRVIKTLVAEMQAPGAYRVVWDGTDEQGRGVSSGVYFCKFRAGGFTATRSMALLR